MRRLALLVLVLSSLVGCNVVPSRDPTGEYFPNARGQTLANEPVAIVDVIEEGPIILIMPFTGDAERDRDDWKKGLAHLGTPVRVYEMGAVPSTAGIVLSPAINAARRDTRREGSWPTTLVFTGDSADQIVTQTGMGRAQYARVLLVGRDRIIAWFTDEGFSPERLTALDQAARRAAATGTSP